EAGVAEDLLDLALADREPPLAALRDRFDALDFDRAALPADFDALLTALTAGLAEALLAEAAQPDSPLHNRVSVLRAAAIHTLLGEQQRTLAEVAAAVTRLEEQAGAARYNVIFLGPATGVAIGDRAAARLTPDLEPLLERALDRLGELARRLPPPYTEADRTAYLQAVIAECETVNLPYASEGRASLPLERVYVALKADRSAPIERKASYSLLRRLAGIDPEALPGSLDERALYRAARLDPYAALHLIHDPDLRGRLLAAAEDRQQKTYHLAEIVRRRRWIVLLGGPGSGKSTLARWLALQLARALLTDQDPVQVPGDHVRPDAEAGTWETLGPARLPGLVRLADYAAARWPQPGEDSRLPLDFYLGSHLEGTRPPGHRPEAFHALLRDYWAAGRVALILDGLDEVTDLAQRQTIAAEIETIIGQRVRDGQGRTPLDPGYHALLDAEGPLTGGNQVLITSRIVGYSLRPLPGSLPHFIIQPLDETAVGRFCRNWAAATGLDRPQALIEAVLEHPDRNVREQMAANPLLLTILAQVFAEDPDRGLPTRRAELYRRATETVFGQRQAHWQRLAGQMNSRDLKAALERVTAHLAWRLHANPRCPAALADEESVREWLAEAVKEEPSLTRNRRLEDVVKDLLAAAANLSGFFVARGQGVYGFLHRQFQEYFAALALTRQADPQAEFLKRLGDPAWREVLLLAAALAGRRRGPRWLRAALEAPDPTEGLLPHNLLFAAAALGELPDPPADLVRSVAAGLIRAYRRDDEARFAVLHGRIEQSFGRLPRAVGRRDPAGEALCEALTKISGEPEARTTWEAWRWSRLAAAGLVVETKWYTPAVARALSAAWQRGAEPAAHLLTALEEAHRADPALFAAADLPFRRAVEAEPALWAAVEAH
ncbi:MAG TPA: NACHT domain-containing protein, partial [Anaerolineae bacterium]|nr:NACHT domain-containing protein [Anaerolineae bacterium]